MIFGGSGKQYCTCPALLEPVYKLTRGQPVALDPCSHPDSVVRARCHVMLPEYGQYDEEPWLTKFISRNGGYIKTGDGLSLRWADYTGIVFVNMPFNDVATWLEKARAEAENGAETVVLTNADTSTSWWHDIVVPHADSMCFFRGRKKYIGAKSSNPLPHLFSYFGYDPEGFREAFRAYGSIMK